MYLPIDYQRKYDGMIACAEESGKSFLNMTSRKRQQLDSSYVITLAFSLASRQSLSIL
jgi:hypothetical protein